MGAKFFYRNIDLVYFVNNKLINNNLITQKDRILLSFSGGQDSICFIFILNQLYSQLEFDITFFWCHHLWQTDSFYLMQQITKLSFLLQFNSCFPIPLNSISSELLARKWRMGCSYRVSLFYNYSKIALAHTFNDKVENIFLNFIRGTGLIGLSPLRWTQFISKSNITNEKHIFRHNYLNNFCIPPTKMNPIPLQGFLLYPERFISVERSWGNANRRFAKPLGHWGKAKMNPIPPTKMNPIPLQGKGIGFILVGGKLRIPLWGNPNSISLRKIPLVLRALPLRGMQSTQSKVARFSRYNFCSSDASERFTRIPPATRLKKSLTGYANRRFAKVTPYPYRAFFERAAGKSSIWVSSKTSSVAELRLPPTKMNFTGLSSVPRKGKAQLANLRFAYPLQIEDLYGVRGMQSKEHGKQLVNCGKDCYIVRPLLSINRIELNKICYFWKLPIYPDKSNQKVKFFRNRVRGQLLPTIKLFFNLNIENIFLQLAKIIETEDYCLTQIVNQFTKNTDVYHTKLDVYSKKKK